MTTFDIPVADWMVPLHDALDKAQPGDVITVPTDSMAKLAGRAAVRMGKTGFMVEVRKP